MARCTLINGTAIDWSSTSSWKEGAVPANGDDVLIPREVQGTITTGLNQSAVTLGSLTVEDGASPKTAGTLQIGSAVFNWYGSGEGFRINGALTATALLGAGRVFFDGGTLTRTYIESGSGWFSDQVDLEPGSGTQRFVVNGGSAEIQTHASKRIPFLDVNGGLVRSYREAEQINVGDGRLEFYDGATCADGASGGLLRVAHRRALVLFVAEDDLEIDALEGLAGTVDWSRVAGDVEILGTAIRSSAFFHTQEWGAGNSLTISGTATPLAPPGSSKSFKAMVA